MSLPLPAPSIHSPVLGSWYFDTPGNHQMVLTLLRNGTYFVAHRDPNAASGMEYGPAEWYWWFEGQFEYSATADTDGTGGLSHSGIDRATVMGDRLFLEATEASTLTVFTRLPASTSSLVGSWHWQASGEAPDATVLSFLPDGSFLAAHYDPQGGSGLEGGTYSWDAQSHALAWSFDLDTAMDNGLSHLGITGAAMQGDDLVLDTASGTWTLRRVDNFPFQGTAGDDSMVGTAAGETLTGLAGDDFLAGAGGVDTAVYSGSRADYEVARHDGGDGYVVTDAAGLDGVDHVSNIERLTFADGNIALDLDAGAGQVARILGVLFGPAGVANEVYVGMGLRLADSGMTYGELVVAGIYARFGNPIDTSEFVDALYFNVTGSLPGDDERALYTGWLLAGMSPSQLAMLAADGAANAAHIDFAGLSAHGLEYV